MSFRFEPAAGSPPWDRERYKIFFNKVSETYPNVEEMVRRAVQVVTSKHGGKPKIKDIVEEVLAMRAFAEDGLRAVQLTPDALVANFLRDSSTPYPGFTSLLDEAVKNCRQYFKCYRPVGVLEVALHYIDLVEIPIPEAGVFASEDYFTLDMRAPGAFGAVASFSINATFRPPGEAEPVELVFATEPLGGDDTHRRFRLEWHTGVRSSARMTDEDVRANLQAAHDRLAKCFRQAFTDTGWALFEPEES